MPAALTRCALIPAMHLRKFSVKIPADLYACRLLMLRWLLSGGCPLCIALQNSSMLVVIVLDLQVCMLVLPFVSLCNDKERHMEKLLKPLDRSTTFILLLQACEAHAIVLLCWQRAA